MKKVDFKNELKVLKENKFYRFADLFFQAGMRWRSDRDTILGEDQYKNTILRKYLEQKKSEIDYVTLKRVVTEHASLNKYSVPTENELVIHLRCGDIFDESDPYYRVVVQQDKMMSSNLFSKKFGAIHYKHIDKVSVVTALHFGANELIQRFFYSDQIYKNNINFLKSFEKRINDCGHEMNLVSNNDFDLDFCYMANSKWFVKSPSRISNLVSEIRS